MPIIKKPILTKKELRDRHTEKPGSSDVDTYLEHFDRPYFYIYSGQKIMPSFSKHDAEDIGAYQTVIFKSFGPNNIDEFRGASTQIAWLTLEHCYQKMRSIKGDGSELVIARLNIVLTKGVNYDMFKQWYKFGFLFNDSFCPKYTDGYKPEFPIPKELQIRFTKEMKLTGIMQKLNVIFDTLGFDDHRMVELKKKIARELIDIYCKQKPLKKGVTYHYEISDELQVKENIDLKLVDAILNNDLCSLKDLIEDGANPNLFYYGTPLINILIGLWLSRGHVTELEMAMLLFFRYECKAVPSIKCQTPEQLLLEFDSDDDEKNNRISQLIKTLYLTPDIYPTAFIDSKTENRLAPVLLIEQQKVLARKTRLPIIKQVSPVTIFDLFTQEIIRVISAINGIDEDDLIIRSYRVKNLTEKLKSELFDIFKDGFDVGDYEIPAEAYKEAKIYFDDLFAKPERSINVLFLKDQPAGYFLWELIDAKHNDKTKMLYIILAQATSQIRNYPGVVSAIIFRTILSVNNYYPNHNILSLYGAASPFLSLSVEGFLNSLKFNTPYYKKFEADLKDCLSDEAFETIKGRMYTEDELRVKITLKEIYGLVPLEDFKLFYNKAMLIMFEASREEVLRATSKTLDEQCLDMSVANGEAILPHVLPESQLLDAVDVTSTIKPGKS